MKIQRIFRYYLPHVKKYKKSTFLVFFSYALATIGTGVLSPLLYKKIVDTISGGVDPYVVSTTLITTVLLLGLVIFLYNLFFRIGDWSMTYSQSRILNDITNDAFRRVVQHSYDFFSSNFTGTLVARVRRYVNSCETIHDQIVFFLWMSGLRLFFALGVLMYFSLILGGIFFVWLALYVSATFFFVKKKFKKDILRAEANSKVTGVLADVFTNMLNVKMFSTQTKEYENFSEATGMEAKYRRDAWNLQNLQFLFQGYFIGFFEFIGMFAVVYLWAHGTVSAGTVVLMQTYIMTSFAAIWEIGRNMTKAMEAIADAEEMVSVFEEPIGVLDRQNPEKINIHSGDILVKNISFAYGEGNAIFENFSLHIKAGEKVGLVGPSGAGKSTITKLLLRFADVQDGGIYIDGQNIAHLAQDDLRRKIAYVPQDPILFHRTLRENISYAKPKASGEEIIDAAKRSHADEFIQSLSRGYDTYVGERGVKLSGGERQRVAIARAILKDAPILILDEATSSLDSHSEMLIQNALDTLMEGKTVIVVAHRLSTIRKMDRIVVIEDGMIQEEGVHEDLTRREGGLYAKLWDLQAGGFLQGSDADY